MRSLYPIVMASGLATAGAAAAAEQSTADAALIASALAAAPKAVAETATVIAADPGGQMRTLRQGTGMFTCMPDNPQSPGTDPMCLDKNGLKWAEAWMAKTDPPKEVIGFGYMLKGGSDASNTDPFATAPASGGKWVDTGPHVMVLGTAAVERMEGYPKEAGDAKSPYVMWGGTPYAHLMIPVGEAEPQTAQMPMPGMPAMMPGMPHMGGGGQR